MRAHGDLHQGTAPAFRPQSLRRLEGCIHPGYRQINEGFWVRIPDEFIYRFSGRNPDARPMGSAAESQRRVGGLMGSGLGLPASVLDAPRWALRNAASGQDSLAIADLETEIYEVTRNQVIPHDALFDHFVALMLIRVTAGDFQGAAHALANLEHFQVMDLVLVPDPEPGTPLAEFYESRGEELRRNWPEFRRVRAES